MPNLVKFREDPDAMLVMALEDYDEVTGKAAKAPILLQGRGRQEPAGHAVTSAEEGLLVSLDRTGGIDLPYIAQLYGKPEEADHRRAGRPDLPRPGKRSLADRRRLPVGQRAGEARRRRGGRPGLRPQRRGPACRCSPRTCCPATSTPVLGAPWIPAADIQAFAAELFGVAPSAIPIGHLKKDAVWSVDAGHAAEASVAATAEYGTRQGQRHLAARARPQHENAGDLRHDPGRRTARSGWSTRRRRWPPARSRS